MRELVGGKNTIGRTPAVLKSPIKRPLPLHLLTLSPFISPENVMYCLMLPFLVHKIFKFYINILLKFKYPAPGPKG